ncbi:MAG: membrane protein [Lysobacterales bacterium]|nr:MAG: membrane protein [Xanthomonadales bacterium]
MKAESIHHENSGRGGALGGRLRLRRESLGLSLEEAARRLKLPVHVLDAIERDDWSALGAAVYVRGHLRAYARLLGFDGEVLERALPFELPPLVATGPVVPAWQRRLGEWGRGMLYAVLTVFIVVPVALFVIDQAPDAPELLPLDEAPSSPVVEETRMAESGMERSEAVPPVLVEPVLASLFPPRPSDRPLPAPQPANELWLRVSASSWIEVRSADGTRLEFATLPAGTERRFPLGDGLTLTIGNVAGTELKIGERTLPIEPWVRANVARFRVSSQGEVQAPADP